MKLFNNFPVQLSPRTEVLKMDLRDFFGNYYGIQKVENAPLWFFVFVLVNGRMTKKKKKKKLDGKSWKRCIFGYFAFTKWMVESEISEGF